MQGMTKLEAANRCLELSRVFRGHQRGVAAFANSIGAMYGWASAPGRLVSHNVFLNAYMCVDLNDTAFMLARLSPAIPDPDYWNVEPTLAAQRMNLAEHKRGPNRRLAPMPAASAVAARGYLAERMDLLLQAEALPLCSGRANLNWHLRRCRKGLWSILGDEVRQRPGPRQR
jgi:hypothetical protein